MIAKVVRGYRPAGLIRYLFGPGKFEEHKTPHVVASWDSAPWLHNPNKLPSVELDDEVIEPGEFDFDLGPLTTTMQELAAAGLPVTNPPAISSTWSDRLRTGGVPADAPSWLKHYRYDREKEVVARRPGYVWHCPVRLHGEDPILRDKHWEYVAERLMKATGIQQAGCRWIAVRHADDHIHLMATLVSETTGKRFYPKNDWPKLRTECQRLERELGLVATASADQTALKEPTRAEKGKAAQRGKQITAREELRRIVAQCAATSTSGSEFLAELAREGLDPKTTHDAAGRVRGYTVARPGDLTANGTPVRFSGTKLAADLTWPKLLVRWASVPTIEPVHRTDDGRVSPVDRRNVLEEVAEAAGRAAGAIRDSHENTEGIAHAAGEVLTALARGYEGYEPGPISRIAERFDRAARTPHRVLPSRLGAAAFDLRQASSRIAVVGALSGRGREKFALLSLVLALAGLIMEIAAWQRACGRIHQATAAHDAATGLFAHAQPGCSRRTVQPPAQSVQVPVQATAPVRAATTKSNFAPSRVVPRLTPSPTQRGRRQ
ncbi:relaxase/mobilization nuclease domain-containing protein [Amycolatopsis sp. lyj-109]|uniref:relaxase/mobilization nuclease domain-containing protein n=1 Tax=Amycolatopsis sp. lyj-109 TaxID=2789287 RepID=UPI00397B7638